jgi:hypothetical protein
MATATLTVLLTFLFTGLVGNWLIQRWQQRNWLNQQRFLGEQKEYENLKMLCDEIIGCSGRRISRMRRLLSALGQPDDKLIRRRLKAYDEVLSEWNEKLNGFHARLTFYAAYDMSWRLEEYVQKRFVALGSELDRAKQSRLSGNILTLHLVAHIETELNKFYGALLTYNRQLLRMLEIQKTKTYYGTRITLNRDNLKHFPTWELIKGLFKPRIQPLTIVRPPTDLQSPFGGRE